MLRSNTDREAEWNPPGSVQNFCRQVKERLSERWSVKLVAYEDDAPQDSKFVSASIVAKTDAGVHAHFSRHHGTNVVLVRYKDSEPVPFEDIAVAKGVLDIGELIRHADVDNSDLPEPVLPFGRILELLRLWTDDLHTDLNPNNEAMASRLAKVADEFVAKTRLFSSES